MARGRNRPDGLAQDERMFVANDETTQPADDGSEVARTWMSRWLEATLGMGLWLEDMQRQGVDAAAHGNETLAAGAREAEESQRIESLLQVPAHMACRQIGLAGLLSFDDLLPACIAPLSGLTDVLRRGMEQEIARHGAIEAPQRPAVRVPAVGTAGWPR